MELVAATIRELTAAECLERLSSRAFVGRLGFIADGKPMILPVNYIVDSDSVLFCSERGTKLSAVGAGAPVVFEIDESRPLHHTGWSVLVAGTALEVTDPTELERLRSGPLWPWAVRRSAHWVRIVIEQISGREIDEHE